MTTPLNPVTDEHLVEFDHYVKKWQELLNLNDWRIERGVRRPKKNMAEVSFKDDAMLATYRIGLSFGAERVTAESLEKTALHELLHVRLRKFKLDPESESLEHEIVNLFEKLLMDWKPE